MKRQRTFRNEEPSTSGMKIKEDRSKSPNDSSSPKRRRKSITEPLRRQREVKTKHDDVRGIITNKRLEELAIGSKRRFLGEIIFNDVVGNLNKNNPVLNKEKLRFYPSVCDLDERTYGHLRIENVKSEGPIFIGFPWGPTINISKLSNLLTNWRWDTTTPKHLTNQLAVKVFLQASMELQRQYGKLSSELKQFLKEMERHDEIRYYFQCYHIECMVLTFGLASDECCGIASDLVPFTCFCYYKNNMVPTKSDMKNNISFGTRLTEQLQAELVEWMRMRINLAVKAPLEYVMKEDSPLRQINIQSGIDFQTFKKCQLMRHYVCNLVVSRNGNFHQQNTQILKQFDNSFKFGKALVLEKYFRNVRDKYAAFREDQKIISTKRIYEFVSLLDGIAAKFWYPEGTEEEILAIVRTGNIKRLSTIRNGRVNCDKCNVHLSDFTNLIKHYSTREYVLSRRHQCPLCTRNRCLRSDLAIHLEHDHGAKETKGRLHKVENPREAVKRKYDADQLVELPLWEAVCGYDERRVRIIEKNSITSDELAQLVTEMNDYSNIITSGDSEDSSFEDENKLRNLKNQLQDQLNELSNTSNDEESDAVDNTEEVNKAEKGDDNSTKEKPKGEEKSGSDDDNEIEMELQGDFNLDGACRSSPSTSPVSLSPDPIKKKEDQPMERKLLKAMLVINSLENDLLAEHNYIETNFVEKIQCIREEVGDAVTEIMTLKSNLAGKTNPPHTHNESTISIHTNNTTGESSPQHDN